MSLLYLTDKEIKNIKNKVATKNNIILKNYLNYILYRLKLVKQIYKNQGVN